MISTEMFSWLEKNRKMRNLTMFEEYIILKLFLDESVLYFEDIVDRIFGDVYYKNNLECCLLKLCFMGYLQKIHNRYRITVEGTERLLTLAGIFCAAELKDYAGEFIIDKYTSISGNNLIKEPLLLFHVNYDSNQISFT